MDFAERYLYLRSMPGGPKFSDRALLPLAEQAEEVAFRRGARLLTYDEMPECVYFLMSGEVELVTEGKVRGIIKSPGAVGVLAVMADGEMPYDVIAKDEVVALAVDTEYFRETFEDNFDIALEIVASLSKNLLVRRQSLPERIAPPLVLPANLARIRELGLVERMLIVRRFDMFGPGALTGLTEVAQQFRETVLEPGQVLFTAGEHAHTFHILLDGAIEMAWPEGKERVGVGPLFSNLETFASARREGTATVVERSRFLYVPWESLVDVLEDHTEMVLAIIARLARTVLQFPTSIFTPTVSNSLRPSVATPAAPIEVGPMLNSPDERMLPVSERE